MAFLLFRIRRFLAVSRIIGRGLLLKGENLACLVGIAFSSALRRPGRVNNGFLLSLWRSRFINDDRILRRDRTLKKRGVLNRLLFGGTLLALIL